MPEELRRKISENRKGKCLGNKKGFKKGAIPWNKGIPMRKETIIKIKNNPNIFKFLGKKHTPESIKKIKEARAIQAPFSEEVRNKMREKKLGEKSPTWKGGITFHRNYKRMKKLRYQNKKFSNGGFHTFKQWEEMKERFNFMCLCCGKKEPEIKLTEDHIVPISKGGSDDIENIQPLCFICNCKKSVNTINYTITLTIPPYWDICAIA